MKASPALEALNMMALEPFVDCLQGIFEQSPWIPRRVWEQRPFADVGELHSAMMAVVKSASPAAQLALLGAHPQLAGKQAREGVLTVLSAQEQKGAGLVDLAPYELEEIEQLNKDYQTKFGFPFIIAVREHTKRSIFEQWRHRLGNTVSTEHHNALEQVFRIARFRLEDLMASMAHTDDGPVSMGKLSTHVLDTTAGKPASGVRIDFSVRHDDNGFQLLKTVYTNSDGRVDEPLLQQASMQPGEYELMFYVGDYYSSLHETSADSVFLDQVPVRFCINDAGQNYHVPLLVSPWSYTTYRGS
ncbi:MAG: 2-oxo-4-hydroxy-4-carboxy-5-ureidoimidazoline decarboxylase [Gammaproteobacteria bacterium]|nr:2-oxo-4-hydroxy-4-carboxy-5-ureidoimidazoline decarboxylase [Gammaproteobacteria bacterium]